MKYILKFDTQPRWYYTDVHPYVTEDIGRAKHFTEAEAMEHAGRNPRTRFNFIPLCESPDDAKLRHAPENQERGSG